MAQVNLPYVKTVSIEAPEYYDFDQFVEQIFTDFNAALSLFSEWDPARTFGLSMLNSFNGNLSGDVFLNCRRFRFNYYAVKALMARLYLYLGQTDKAYDMAMKSDGVIVGSAIVRLCEEYGRDSVPYVSEYTRNMKEAVRRAGERDGSSQH